MHHPQQPPPYHLHQQQAPQFQQQQPLQLQQQQPQQLLFGQQQYPQQADQLQHQQAAHQMQYQSPQQQIHCQQQISPPAYDPMEQVVPLQNHLHQHHSHHQHQHQRHHQQQQQQQQQQNDMISMMQTEPIQFQPAGQHQQQNDMISMMQTEPIQFQPAGQHQQQQHLQHQHQQPQHQLQLQQQHQLHHHQLQHLQHLQQQQQQQRQQQQAQRQQPTLLDPYTKELSDIMAEIIGMELTLKETRDIKEQIAIDLQQGARTSCLLKARSEVPIEDYTRLVKTRSDQEKMVRDNFEKLRVFCNQLYESQNIQLRRVTKILEAIIYGHLPKWHRDQQLASNSQPQKLEGTSASSAGASGLGTNDNKVLNIIQSWVERIIDIIWKLRMQLKFLYDIVTHNEIYIFDFDKLFILGQRLDRALEQMILKSFVVDKQPPQVMKTNTRFSSSVRFLGGSRLNLSMISPTVRATILSEGNARAVIREHRHMVDASWAELESMLEKQQQRQAGLLPPSPDPPYSFSHSPDLCQAADAAALAALQQQQQQQQQQEQQAFFQQQHPALRQQQQQQQFNPSDQSPPQSMAQQYGNQQSVQAASSNMSGSTSNNPSPPALSSPYQQQPPSVASSTTTTTSTTNAPADLHSMMASASQSAYYQSGSPTSSSVVAMAGGAGNSNHFQHQHQQAAACPSPLLDRTQDNRSKYLQRVQQEKLRQRKLKEQQEPRQPPKIVNINDFDPSGEILNNNNMLEYLDGTNQMLCHFRNMQLKKIKRTEKKGTESVMDEKFVLLFHLEFRIAELSDPARSNSYWHKQEDLAFHIMAFSLPVVVIVHGNQEPHAWATVTWHNAFAKQSADEPLYQVPDKVTWQELGQVLSEKFRTNAGKGLSSQNLSYLATKVGRAPRRSTSGGGHHHQNGNSPGSSSTTTELGQDNNNSKQQQTISSQHSSSDNSINNVSESNGSGNSSSASNNSASSTNNNNNMITWAQFSKETLPDKSFTFWEWFHSILKLTKEHLRDLWKDDRIFGFVGKSGCVDLLLGSSMHEPRPLGTFLLRYSETELGGITVAWVANSSQDNKGRGFMQILKRRSPTNSSSNFLYHLQPFVSKDLHTRSLADRVRDLGDLVYLYPDIPKDEAFVSYYTPLTEVASLSNGYVRPMLIQTLAENYSKNLAANSVLDPSLTPNSNSPDAASYQDQAFSNEMDTTCSYHIYRDIPK